jgi:hypothetical protein
MRKSRREVTRKVAEPAVMQVRPYQVRKANSSETSSKPRIERMSRIE